MQACVWGEERAGQMLPFAIREQNVLFVLNHNQILLLFPIQNSIDPRDSLCRDLINIWRGHLRINGWCLTNQDLPLFRVPAAPYKYETMLHEFAIYGLLSSTVADPLRG